MNEQSAVLTNVIGPAVVVVAAVLGLAVVSVLVYALIKPSDARRKIEGLFRKPRRERPVGDGHYYKPYWKTK